MTTEFNYELRGMNIQELEELKRIIEAQLALLKEKDRLVKLLKGE